jgi:hypothetical protein
MLNRVKGCHNFKTEAEGVEVEGQFIDILTMINYSLTTNPMAYETWFSLPIYQSDASAAIK